MVTPQKHLHHKSEQFQQQQQPSPRIEGAAAEQSPHLTGSHPGTNACGARTVGRSSERQIGSQLLGQRNLQDLVSRIHFDKFRGTWSRHLEVCSMKKRQFMRRNDFHEESKARAAVAAPLPSMHVYV
ncbi:uncharacterized protein A4U43_C08F36410 [Asparagus officinalis]|nr:uncharacterized protein A4U43_C08F36410 [Asparagus officinalis]